MTGFLEGTASKWSQQRIPEAVKGINSRNNPNLLSVETLNQADRSLCSNYSTYVLGCAVRLVV
jgi:hypothetical protein